MSDTLKQTLTLTIGEDSEKEEFTFRVPTPMDKARLGVREASVRRSLDPMGGGAGWGIDDETFFLIKGMVALEVLLDKASVTWPYSEFKPERGAAELRVDIDAFPPGKELVISEIGRRFSEELDRFHRDRAERQRPAAAETVAGGQHPEALRSVESKAA